MGRLTRHAFGLPGIVAFSVLVLATALWGSFSLQAGRLACIWLCNPVLLAILLRSPGRLWLPFAGASLGANLVADAAAFLIFGRMTGPETLLACALALVNVLEVLISAYPLHRLFGTGIDLTRVRDLRLFVVLGAVVGPALSGLAAAVLLSAAGDVPALPAWTTWVSADALGILTVTPLILIATSVEPMRLSHRRGALETGLGLLLLLVVLGATFSHQSYPLLFAPLVVLVHLGMRFGPAGAAIGIGATAAMAYAATFNGRGPVMLVADVGEQRLFVLEAYLAAAVLAVLPTVAGLADRERLGRKLRLAEAMFRGVFENSPEMLVVCRMGEDGVPYVETSNPASSALMVVPSWNVQGSRVDAVMEPSCAREFLAEIGRVFETNQPVRVLSGFEQRNRYFTHERIYVPLQDEADGRVRRVLASIRDMTHVAEADAAVRASEARQRLISDSTTDMIVELDRDLNRLHVSRASVDLLGYEPDEMLGISPTEQIYPDDLPELLERLRRDPGRGGRQTHAYRMRRKDGCWIWVETAWQGIYDDAGAMIGLVSSVRDIDQRKKAERDLRDARHEAEAARREAERASEAKSQFLANMSHEIRTPLHGIGGYTRLLLRDPSLTEPQRHALERIQTASAALGTVVDDILDFSKIEAGQIDLDPVPFELARLVEDVLAIVRGSAIERGLRIDVRIAEGLPERVVGDEKRLRQILLNLVVNAVKFTPSGEVVLAVDDLGTGKGGRRIRFSVADTGIGICPEQHERLFKRFSQVDGSTTRRFGGTGLGLAISQQLVGLMGGSIEVESRRDEGSTFSFVVALDAAHGSDGALDDATRSFFVPPATGSSRRILVVEDVQANRELAIALLESSGHEADGACDGAQAVAMVRDGRYDLVLMDVQMPIMDGLEATRRIRASTGPEAVVPIIAMTANVMSDQIIAIRAAGMNGRLGKPFALQDLNRIVAEWTGTVPTERDAPADDPGEGVLERLASTVGSETAARIIEAFERDLVERLPERLQDADRGRLARDAHSIVGEAGQLGFPELAAACRLLVQILEIDGDVARQFDVVSAERTRALADIGVVRQARMRSSERSPPIEADAVV
jgi:PAS domain S-box-containing protein